MRNFGVLFFVLLCNISLAQIFPAEGDTLNYLVAGFSVPKSKDAVKYIFKIAEGTFDKYEEFSKHVIVQSKPGANKQVVDLPGFGKQYSWTVSYIDKANKTHHIVEYHHFATGYLPQIDTNLFRLRIVKPADVHKDSYVMPDKVTVMYSMEGKPVWYLPYSSEYVTDLKPTAEGTFTYLDDKSAYEVKYNGQVIWEAPDNGKMNGESSERYHHQLTKLNNGNYMVMGYETVLRPLPDSYIPADSLRDRTVYKDGQWFSKVDAGTLIEYDARGNVVWSWRASSEYTYDKYFGRTYWEDVLRENTGMNAFCFDEKTKVIYISFAKLNNIVKIQYPDGKLLAVYGKPGNAERQQIPAKLFYNQHDIKLSEKGTLYLFNNNTFSPNSVSTITAWREFTNANQGLQKVWEYRCVLDDSTTFIRSVDGGNVHLFADSTVLAATGKVSRMFIIKPNKELAWDAIPEHKNDKGAWAPLPYDKVGVVNSKNDIVKGVLRMIK